MDSKIGVAPGLTKRQMAHNMTQQAFFTLKMPYGFTLRP
jgi:hypothetical protein